LCLPEYVDPYYLEDFIANYPDVTFVLMHGGQDFAEVDDTDIPYYNGTNFDHTIDLMERYDNIVLEISAMLAGTVEEDGTTVTYRNPLAYENLLKVVSAGMQGRSIYGSDANQFPGGIASYLYSTIVSLINAGLSEEERCAVLVTNPKEVYNIPDSSIPPGTTAPTTGTGGTPAPSSTGTAPPSPTTTTIAPTMAPTVSEANSNGLRSTYLSMALVGVFMALL
jgi:hypothetical protein